MIPLKNTSSEKTDKIKSCNKKKYHRRDWNSDFKSWLFSKISRLNAY
jgi:hypothetical protein